MSPSPPRRSSIATSPLSRDHIPSVALITYTTDISIDCSPTREQYTVPLIPASLYPMHTHRQRLSRINNPIQSDSSRALLHETTEPEHQTSSSHALSSRYYSVLHCTTSSIHPPIYIHLSQLPNSDENSATSDISHPTRTRLSLLPSRRASTRHLVSRRVCVSTHFTS